MEIEDILKRLKELREEGENVKSTVNRVRYSNVIDLTPDTVNKHKFIKWQSKCIIFLEQILKPDDFRLNNFKNKVKTNYYYQVIAGIGIIDSLIEDIEDGNFEQEINMTENNSNEIIENILNKFHRVARQLRIRHANRNTIEIRDEYDVQDLLQALLLINFEDVRSEEWTPSYGGKSSRMDFLIKDENIVIETKNTRENLRDKKLTDELIIDTSHYSKHPDCDILYCFVYDVEEFIKNPKAIENDLSGQKDGLEVKVMIRPQR